LASSPIRGCHRRQRERRAIGAATRETFRLIYWGRADHFKNQTAILTPAGLKVVRNLLSVRKKTRAIIKAADTEAQEGGARRGAGRCRATQKDVRLEITGCQQRNDRSASLTSDTARYYPNEVRSAR
jgi:hypothetical protein